MWLILEGLACIRLEMEDPASIGFKKQIIGREFLCFFELGSSHKNEGK
jgi:hypothetical protein